MKVLGLLMLPLLAGPVVAGMVSGADELRTQLARDDVTLVAFVVPESEASKALFPEWETVQQSIPSALTISCSATPDLCREMDVVSMPAVRLFQRDKPVKRYRGVRKAESIISFVDRVLQPVVSSLTDESASSFAAGDDVVFVAHLQSKDESLTDLFSTIAQNYHDRYSFGMTDSADGQSKIQCHNNLEAYQYTITDLDVIGALEKFVDLCTEPRIPQLTRRNEMKYLAKGKSLVYYFTANASDQSTYTNAMRPLAESYQEYLKLVTVDSAEYPDMARGLGIRHDRGLSVRNLHNGQVFPYDGDIVPEQVGAFIVAISQGQVRPWDGTFDTAPAGVHDEL